MVHTSQNVPPARSQRGPRREWMKTVSAQAVCIDGMQLRGVKLSKAMGLGDKSLRGKACGQKSPTWKPRPPLPNAKSGPTSGNNI